MNKYQMKRKMSPEELELWIHLRKKCQGMKKKKGKGSYSRKTKYKKKYEDKDI